MKNYFKVVYSDSSDWIDDHQTGGIRVPSGSNSGSGDSGSKK